MIDWLTLRAYIDAPVDGGMVCSFTADGELEWSTPKRLKLEGSHSSIVTVRRFPYDNTLEISGNPAKFFQGHNLFGSGDLLNLSRAFVLAVCDRLGYRLTAGELERLSQWIYLTRIDTTEMWDFGNQARAVNVIRALGERSHLAYRGRGSLLKDGTCYWNKNSTRLAGKAYAKGVELKAHKLPDDLPFREELLAYAEAKVRAEFTIRGPWLKRRHLELVQNWSRNGVTPESLHAEIMADLSVTDAVLIETADQDNLPGALRLVYDAWHGGKDLRRILPRSTFYKRRRQLLEHGIDIAATVPADPVSNVVPLRVTFEGKSAQVPAWAVGTPLYFEPSKIAA